MLAILKTICDHSDPQGNILKDSFKVALKFKYI